jgi:hypothetical protein
MTSSIGQEGQTIVQQPHNSRAQAPGIDVRVVTNDGDTEAIAPTEIQRTIWTKDEN